MAVTVVAQLLGSFTGLPQSLPTDQDNDSNAAPNGNLNVFVTPIAQNGGFLSVGPVPAAMLEAIANGGCTVTITQGAGTTSITTTQ